MTAWFTIISSTIQILLIFLRRAERDKIVAEAEMVDRARTINKINASLVEAAKIPRELAILSDKELDEYVQKKGWYRD